MADAPAENQPGAEAAALPPRTPTFLANYPRKVKLGVVGGLFVFVFLLWFFHAGGDEDQDVKDKVTHKVAAVVSGADSRAAIANPAPAPIPGTMGVIKKDDRAEKAARGEETSGQEESKAFLKPAPDPGLSEDTNQGSLPRVGEDGRQPWQVYARPFDTTDKRPRIAIVITDLGLKRVETDAAIARLPPNVTLAFDSQNSLAGAWLARARAAGHETLLTLPMEPFDYPRSDPGPNTLLSNIPQGENLQRLQHSLMQGTGYVGVTTLSGTRFTTDPTQITPVLEELRKRGLMVFDARVAPHSAIADLARDAHVPVAVDTQRIDQNLSPAAIEEALSQLEQTARLTGRAVAMAPPYPVVIDVLLPWIKQLPKDGIALAPLSAMVQ